MIYPEGGRSPDGWGQEFKGGAAYLVGRTGAPVVPVFIDGTGVDLRQGHEAGRKAGKTKVVFGSPLSPIEGESTRRFNARIEAAVTSLGDEALTDYWTARRRAAPVRAPNSPARSTTVGAASGPSPSIASWARPASVAARSAAGPTSADPAAPPTPNRARNPVTPVHRARNPVTTAGFRSQGRDSPSPGGGNWSLG